MDSNKAKQQKLQRRHGRVRSKVKGALAKPRLSVFRSSRGMFLQLIDDLSGQTLASVGVKEVKAAGKKIDLSREMGKLLAAKAKDKNIKRVVFDRGAYKYHGRVKAVAEGAREGGLEF